MEGHAAGLVRPTLCGRPCAADFVQPTLCNPHCASQTAPYGAITLKFPVSPADETKRRCGCVMFSNLPENPKLFRHVLEDLPVGIYLVDRELRIRFWNRRAELLTGHLGQEVVGHILEDIVQACDRGGHRSIGEHCPVTITLRQGLPQHCIAYYLHKNGHRVALRIRTRAVP